MKGAGLVLNTISDGAIPYWLGAAMAYGVVLLYVFFSGVMGVGWTNTFQGIFMLSIAWFLGLYLPKELHGGIGPMFEAIQQEGLGNMLQAPGLQSDGSSWSWAGFSSAVMISAIGFSMWPHFFMKTFAAKDDRTMKLTVVLYPTFQLFLLPILFIGFSAILSFPGIEPADTILPYVLRNMDLPVVLVGLVCAGTLAASMSSGDAILHAAGAVFVRDGLRKFPQLRTAMDQKNIERKVIQLSILLISILAYYFAVISSTDIVSLLLGAYGGVAQLFPLVFAMFYWPSATRLGALTALISGIFVTLVFLFWPELKPWDIHEGIYGLMVNLFSLITVSFLTQKTDSSIVEKFTHA